MNNMLFDISYMSNEEFDAFCERMFRKCEPQYQQQLNDRIAEIQRWETEDRLARQHAVARKNLLLPMVRKFQLSSHKGTKFQP